MLGGFQNFAIEWIVNQEYSEDDYLMITLSLDYPTDLASTDDILVQYAQYSSALDTTGASETIVCKTTIDSSDNSVDTFRGIGDNSNAAYENAGANDPQAELNGDEKVTDAADGLWMKIGDDTDYDVYESSIPGNSHFTCVVELAVSKEGRDFGMFGDYMVKIGARVMKADSSAFVNLGERDTEYWLDEPRYAEIDPEEQMEEYFWDIILEREFPIDIAKALNNPDAQQRAQMRVVSWFGSTTNYGADDIIEILIELDLPRNILSEG